MVPLRHVTNCQTCFPHFLPSRYVLFLWDRPFFHVCQSGVKARPDAPSNCYSRWNEWIAHVQVPRTVGWMMMVPPMACSECCWLIMLVTITNHDVRWLAVNLAICSWPGFLLDDLGICSAASLLLVVSCMMNLATWASQDQNGQGQFNWWCTWTSSGIQCRVSFVGFLPYICLCLSWCLESHKHRVVHSIT